MYEPTLVYYNRHGLIHPGVAFLLISKHGSVQAKSRNDTQAKFYLSQNTVMCKPRPATTPRPNSCEY